MSVRVVYRDFAPGAEKSATVAATGQDGRSDVALLPFGSGNAVNYATLEHNLWTLDGSYDLWEEGVPVSLWSEEISGDDGTFAFPPTVTVTFDRQFTSSGVSLVFFGDTWSEVTIQWYRGAALLNEADFAPDAMEYFCENTVRTFDKLVLIFTRTGIPNRRLRLDFIAFGKVRIYERDELRSGSVRIEQEIDPTGQTLPANTLDWTLDSKEPVKFDFQFKQAVYAYDGDELYGVFYIDDADRLGDRLYDVTCTDAIGVMDADTFPDAYYKDANAYDLAKSICEGYLLEMDESLQAKTVTGVLKGETRRGALRQLCFMLGAVADTSGGTDAIRIFPLDSEQAKTVPVQRIRTGASVKEDRTVTAVKLTAHTYSRTGSENASQVDINGTIYYDTETVVTVTNPDLTPSDRANIVEITEATLVSMDNAQEIAERVYDYYMQREMHKLDFRLAGERPGDYLETTTPWLGTFAGRYVRGSLTLSGFALSQAEIVGKEEA